MLPTYYYFLGQQHYSLAFAIAFFFYTSNYTINQEQSDNR